MKYKYLILLLLLPILAGAQADHKITVNNSNSGAQIINNSIPTSLTIGNEYVVYAGEKFYPVMSFSNKTPTVSSLWLRDIDYNYCVVDWGNGQLEKISTIGYTSSVISASNIKIYSRNSLGWMASNNNKFVFDIIELPRDMMYINVQGSNYIYGNILDIPSSTYFFWVIGINDTYGDIATIPYTVTSYSNKSWNDTVTPTYSYPHAFNPAITYFNFNPTEIGLTSIEVDNLLIDLDNSEMSSGAIYITGQNASRTSLSDAAVASLTGADGSGKTVTVTTN